MRSMQSRKAGPSPDFASSMAFRVIASASPSRRVSAAKVTRWRAPLGFPGLPRSNGFPRVLPAFLRWSEFMCCSFMPPLLHEGAQLIVEREVQVAEAAGLPELHLPDSKLGQAILRAVTADDDAKLRLVRPGRPVRDVIQGDPVAVLRGECRRLRWMRHDGRAHVVGRWEAFEASDCSVRIVGDALV